MDTFEFKVGGVVYRSVVCFDEYAECVRVISGSAITVSVMLLVIFMRRDKQL